MKFRIELDDIRFAGMVFTVDERHELICQMFSEGVYTPDHFTPDYSACGPGGR